MKTNPYMDLKIDNIVKNGETKWGYIIILKTPDGDSSELRSPFKYKSTEDATTAGKKHLFDTLKALKDTCVILDSSEIILN